VLIIRDKVAMSDVLPLLNFCLQRTLKMAGSVFCCLRVVISYHLFRLRVSVHDYKIHVDVEIVVCMCVYIVTEYEYAIVFIQSVFTSIIIDFLFSKT
jgi:hypothetical protein